MRGSDFIHAIVPGDRERFVAVKIVAYDGRGRRRFRKTGKVFLRKIQPNGPREPSGQPPRPPATDRAVACPACSTS